MLIFLRYLHKSLIRKIEEKINDFLKKQFRIVLINDDTLEEEGGIRL